MRVSFFTCHRCARTRRMDLGLIGYVEFPVPSSATAAAMAFRCTAQSSRLHFAPRAPLCILATPRFLKLSVLSRGTSITRPLATSASPQSTFTWENALLAGAAGEEDEELDFRGYFEKVRNCNRGYERRSEFVPFTGEGQLLGYIHKGFLDHLSKFDDVFDFVSGEKRPYISLNPSLSSPEDRTAAVGVVIKCLGGLIPGIRNEMYPVTHAFGTPPYFSLERAAAPYFGIKAYGVHMNGYVEEDGQKFLWIGKRSDTKPTFPGMLDHLVAGGMSHGISCKDTLVKECEEEAGIPRSISDSGIPVGAVSYVDIDGPRYKRDVLFCYDLKLHDGFIPKNEDGEVQSFKLIPVSQVANIIRRTCLFKPNCSLVIMDFLFRHGFMNPDAPGYLELLQSLRRGECS